MKGDSATRHKTIIVGAGIAGLSALHALRRRGDDAILLEGSGRVGGTILTVEAPWGGPLELGPNTLRGSSEVLERLIDEIDLRDAVRPVNEAARHRYILHKGVPRALPRSPREGVETDLLSVGAKLRLLLEPFRGRVDRGLEDESIASFVRRRLGPQVAERFVDPLVSGIYAGDPTRLSLRHTFPMLDELEREHGSLLRGMMRKGKQRRRSGKPRERKRPFSFVGGLGDLPRRLAELHGEAIRLDESVRSISRTESGLWRVESSRRLYPAEHVILTVGADIAADLLETFESDGSTTLRGLPSAPVAVVALLYRKEAFAEAPRGFGMLVPSSEEREVLGVIYSSSIFPDRVPVDHELVTLFIGGARRPELALLPETELTARAAREIASIYGVSDDPAGSIQHTWRPGIPQYTVGYDDVLHTIAEVEERNPGLHLLGNYRGGVSVPDRVERGLGATTLVSGGK